MTREDIEQLNVVEPYCFESDREKQWYNVGLKHGLEIADNHPINPWIRTKDKLPPEGEQVLAFNKKWIDEDFNPNGTRIGFLNGNKEFTSAYWWDYQDSYVIINKSIREDDEDFYVNLIDNTEPEYWMPIPELPKE